MKDKNKIEEMLRQKAKHSNRIMETSLVAVQISKQLFSQFIENTPAPIAMFDRDMKYIMTSRRFLTDYNLKIRNIIGHSHYEVFPEIPERWKEVHRRCLAGATEKADDDPFPRADGGLDWVHWEIQPWYEANGEIGGIILFSEVVTERKQIEEALSEKGSLLAESQQIAHIGSWRYDIEGRITWSDETYNIYGVSPDTFIPNAETFINLIHPDDRSAMQAWINACISGENPGELEFRTILPDGDIRFIRGRGELKYNTGNRPIHITGTAQDITERKQIEEERTQSAQKLIKAMESTIEAMTTTVEMRDPYTAGHQRRVAALVSAIAGEMGISEDQVYGISMAGIVHDIGKISIPAEILSRPGKLSKIEFDLIKTHPQAGYNILKDIEFPWPIAQTILQHHERMDGSGYPAGLSKDAILLEARILAVADVVEAMVSHRPYRSAIGLDGALEEVSMNSGILYDADVVDVCIRLFQKKGFKFESQN